MEAKRKMAKIKEVGQNILIKQLGLQMMITFLNQISMAPLPRDFLDALWQ